MGVALSSRILRLSFNEGSIHGDVPDILAGMRTLFASLLFIAVLAANVSAQAPAPTPTPNSAPPKMELLDLKGGHHTLDEHKGKVVVLNFWATYCVPCASEMPMLSRMQRRYKDKIIVLAVSVDDATLFIDAEGKVAGKVEGALKRPDLEKRLAEMAGAPVAAKTANKNVSHRSSEPKSSEK